MFLVRYRHIKALALLVLAMVAGVTIQPARAQDQRCFPETNQCIEGRFRQYWEQNDGLAVFGFPITPARDERNRDTGQIYLTQWFERNRFELHPENAAPYDVLLGRLGDDRLIQIGRDWQQEGREPGPQNGCLWFEQTGKNVCNQEGNLGFRAYWESHGLQDPRLDAYQRSLALFGLPLTAPRTETNPDGDTVLTQWFERARFEWHPDKPNEYKVLLGRLGDEIARAATPGPAPTGRIAFVSSAGNDAGGDIYLMNADGSGQTRLTNTNAIRLESSDFAVSPTGDRIAYRVGSDLYVIPTAGGEPKLFASTTNARPEDFEVFAPTWAPDGSYLAYVLNGNIYARTDVNTPPVQITKTGDISQPASLSWASNGYLTYRTPAMHTFKLWVIRSDGSDARQLAWGLCGTLSPSGDRMAYMNGDLWSINFDGSDNRALTSGRVFLPGRWSPNATQIAAVGYDADDPDDRALYIVDPARGGQRAITSDLAVEPLSYWSPDNTFVSFTVKQNDQYSVYVVGADGNGLRRLSTPAQAAWAQWVEQ